MESPIFSCETSTVIRSGKSPGRHSIANARKLCSSNPAKVFTPKVQLDLTAFSVLAPVVEEEPVAAEAEAVAAGPEVITEKKEEGEAATAAAPASKEKAPK